MISFPSSQSTLWVHLVWTIVLTSWFGYAFSHSIASWSSNREEYLPCSDIATHDLIVVLIRLFFSLCQVVGTYGYAAPEYVDTGHLTVKSDIYSFGVVLYEILSGRRTLERNRPTAEQKLIEWVKQYPVDSNRFRMIIDPRLRNQYSISAARKIAKLADSCLIKSAKDRPTMGHVVEILKQALEESEEASSSENRSSESSASKHAATLNKPPRRAGITDNASRATQSPRQICFS